MEFLYLLLILLFVWCMVTLVFTVHDQTVWFKRASKKEQLMHFARRYWYWFRNWFSELSKPDYER